MLRDVRFALRTLRRRRAFATIAIVTLALGIGAATAIASPDNSASELVATADAALYRAKHMGRNRISLPISELA